MTKVKELASMTFAVTGGDLETATTGDIADFSGSKGLVTYGTNENIQF